MAAGAAGVEMIVLLILLSSTMECPEGEILNDNYDHRQSGKNARRAA